MELVSYISCVILGIALGVGGDWLFWQRRFKQANDRVREESKAVGQAFNSQIEGKERQLKELSAEHASALKAVREQLAAAAETVDRLKERLHEEERKLAEAQALTKRLPDLEKLTADQQAAIARLTADLQTAREQQEADRQEAAEIISGLKVRLVEERKAFDGAMVYVQGGHYLPASVVRNLTRRTGPAVAADEEERES